MTTAQVIARLERVRDSERGGLILVAARAGVSVATLYLLMGGKAVKDSTLAKIAAALNGKKP